MEYLPADGKVDQDTLPKIKMPNRDGFIPDQVSNSIMNRTPRLNAARGDERLSVPGADVLVGYGDGPLRGAM